VANDDRLLDPQQGECPQEELGLLEGPPPSTPWTLAIAEAWTVEGNDAMAARSALSDAAGDEVSDHAAVAMQKDDGSASAFLEIVQPRTVYCDEPIDRPVIGHSTRKSHDSTPAKTRGGRSSSALRVHHR
jgi:hypothetical protein